MKKTIRKPIEEVWGTNTLVRHKKLKTLGIGYIAKKKWKSYEVNWGTDDVKLCKQESLELVDVSKCNTVSWNVVRNKIITQQGPDIVIVGNELKEYVGIGWVTLRAITEDDLKKYPRAVQ